MYSKKIELAKERERSNRNVLNKMRERQTATLKKTAELIKLRNKQICEQKSQDIPLLLYTNIIQQNIYYVSNLQQKIADLEKAVLHDQELHEKLHNEMYLITQDMEKAKLKLEQELKYKEEGLKRQISRAKKQLSVLAPIEKISDPIASQKPMKPKKMLILAVASVLGCLQVSYWRLSERPTYHARANLAKVSRV